MSNSAQTFFPPSVGSQPLRSDRALTRTKPRPDSVSLEGLLRLGSVELPS
ncbi:hypothetical protein ACFH04_11830 [Streptomyces noboritoensis]|uniref:Uncharacterized protein n=1 Tax=Streptomyces noboritoensis TaxID=67337 RepID=A0ABV6TF28_9ACTN